MKLGLLDFGEVYKDTNSIEVIHNTINYCQLAEQFGYTRYWLAEHYSDSVAWRNAEIIITLLLGYTEKIKIGPAGVKLDVNQSSFHIAQNYNTLASIFENRVDIGFAKGIETKEIMDVIMDTDVIEDRFLRINKILKLFNNEYKSISLVPTLKIKPEFWMLSASNSNHNYCIENRLNLSISLFHNVNGKLPSNDILTQFKDDFYKKNNFEPNINIAISVFCNNSQKRIKNEISYRENVAINVIGTPVQCQNEIQDLLYKYKVDEAIILNLGRNDEEKKFLINNIKK